MTNSTRKKQTPHKPRAPGKPTRRQGPKKREAAKRAAAKRAEGSDTTASPAARSPGSSEQPLSPDGNRGMCQVILDKPAAHPNIFRKRIREIRGTPQVGDWVAAYHTDNDNQQPELFGYGLYNSKSEIAIRLVRWSPELPDDSFWDSLLDRALELRTDTMKLDAVTNGYRVLHAEADGTPGLVVERYDDCLSAEVSSIAMAQRAQALVERLATKLGTQHWLIRPSPHLLSQEGFDFQRRASADWPSRIMIHEHGVAFQVHLDDDRKTEFLCDQRENRKKLSEMCHGKTVLDVCCSTGGFSVLAAKLGEAAEVTGVDFEAAPLEIAKRNAAINGVRAKFKQADPFAYMRDMLREGKQFEIVVLDPPKLIRSSRELEEGSRKHFDLNRLAMQLVKPGGMMLTCTRSGLLQEHDFTRIVRAAARAASRASEFNPNPEPRPMQILARSGAAVCHPVSANCPETEYLKAMWLRM